jgi:hypothetical protein
VARYLVAAAIAARIAWNAAISSASGVVLTIASAAFHSASAPSWASRGPTSSVKPNAVGSPRHRMANTPEVANQPIRGADGTVARCAMACRTVV